ILRKYNPMLKGLSFSVPTEKAGFNVAVPGANSSNLPLQAQTLVELFRKEDPNLSKSWKLIFIFIGTNDLGSLRCHISIDHNFTMIRSERYLAMTCAIRSNLRQAMCRATRWNPVGDPRKFAGTRVMSKENYISREDYKKNVEETITILRRNLPKTIVAIIPMWHPRLSIEAEYLIDKHREECWSRKDVKDLHEVSRQYTEVNGAYNKKFYASDLLHMSKYGNAALALHLWNCMLEPTGKKNQKADLSNDGLAVQCPKQPYPYIRTLGNSLL
ncbi:hypothetical protein ANCDUO_14955, partial [Ancylostoma duodenale]